MKRVSLLAVTGLALSVILNTGTIAAQRDPGPRAGDAGAGEVMPGLSPELQSFFDDAREDFMEVDSVSGTISGEEGSGLGPTFNGNGCAQCHAFPAVGGSSPITNPQVALANLDGAKNTVPSFITTDGPVREARFIRNPDGSLDGGVHGLYTITGRTDAEGCTLAQPDFARQLANRNVIFRIPTPTFGLGLVEATPDSTLQANLAANRRIKSQLGIGGTLNTSGNDGTVTRFGWKAQNKSLMVFAGEAYNVEQGVSNEAFGNERSAVPGCVYNGSPEDATKMVDDNGSPVSTAAALSSDLVNFSAFMRLSGAANPGCHVGLGEKWGQPVRQRGLCLVSHLHFDHRHVEIYRNVKRHLSPVLRFRPPPYGVALVGRRQSRGGRSGPVPHRSALGYRPAPVFPA